MDSCSFFLNVMYSLDAAFLARQGLGPRQSNSWGERFFQELSLNHPRWVDHVLPIYMKACEILHYFAFFARAEEMVPIFAEKPEALLRMVLTLMRHSQTDPRIGKIRLQASVDHNGNVSGE